MSSFYRISVLFVLVALFNLEPERQRETKSENPDQQREEKEICPQVPSLSVGASDSTEAFHEEGRCTVI